jgi:hypothetical protein
MLIQFDGYYQQFFDAQDKSRDAACRIEKQIAQAGHRKQIAKFRLPEQETEEKCCRKAQSFRHQQPFDGCFDGSVRSVQRATTAIIPRRFLFKPGRYRFP